MACPLATERVWTEKSRYHEAEKNYFERLSKVAGSGQQCTLVSEIAKARQHIKNSLERMDGIAALAATPSGDALERLNHLEKDNENLRKLVDHLQKSISEIHIRMKNLEDHVNSTATTAPAPKGKPAENKKNECEDDDGVDLFASDSEEEDTTAAKLREQRLAEYNAKKSKKPALIAKSSVILDVKPWDDETNLKKMESAIRKIGTDGLLWGAAKFVPVAFGIQKLSISCVVEDEKVSIDWLTEEIEKLDSFVQSVDVAAFNKI